jgi:ferredoxin
MKILHVKDGVVFVLEWRYCVNCGRMFCLNVHAYDHVTRDSKSLYAHKQCPQKKPERKLLV